MVKVGNQGLDDRYVRLRSHRISHPVVSRLRQSDSITFSRPGFRPCFHVWFRSTKKLWQKTTTQIITYYKSNAVHLPIPNCRLVDLYVSPVTNRHNATATRLFTGIHLCNLVSFFAKSGPTKRTMYSNVRLDILKFSFHHSSTKFPFNRVSNQNWFLDHDHARLTRLVLRRAICSRINRFRLDLFRCCKSKSCCNLDSWVC